MRIKIATSVLLVFYAYSGLLLAQGKSTDFVFNRGDLVEDLLFKYYDSYSFNGSVLVAEGDEIVYENTFGFADIEHEVPLDNKTPFYIASLGKQFTAAAVMKLFEEGKLNLDDPVSRYFPLLPGFYTEVKIRNLLNHTSGIPDYLNSSEVHSAMDNKDVYRYLLTLSKLSFEPGSKYRYCNTGYALLAMIIEVASGTSADEYFEDQFFRPLGMQNTYVHSKQTVDRARAHGFNTKDKPDDYALFTVGDGGFYSTSEDLFTWLKALNDDKIISKASLELMYQPLVLASGREKRYGFGWELGSNSLGPLVYHTGQLAGFRTYLERQNNTGTTIVILSNNSFAKMSELRNQLVKILDGRLTSIPEE